VSLGKVMGVIGVFMGLLIGITYGLFLLMLAVVRYETTPDRILST
jgi:hypothetical protein